jgi:sec-independent protein translocase protein TatC
MDNNEEDNNLPLNKNMTLIEHLEEFRSALIIIVSTIIISTVFCFYKSDFILDIISRPLLNKFPNIKLVIVSPGEAFFNSIKISFFIGFILSLPIVLNRLYWFIAPGLTLKELRLFKPLIIFFYILFMLGLLFSYFILLPIGINFLIDFTPNNIIPMISIDKYISFIISTSIGTSIVFELPMILFTLAFLGIININKLKKFRKYSFLIAFIVSAIITPSVDVFTQTSLALVLYFLYELTILLLKLTRINKKQIN